MLNRENPFKSLRLNQLPLLEVTTRLKAYKAILQKELKMKGISFDFHIWVSDEWFCPDGVPGFAVPFYLFHPQLMALHKTETGLIEGRSEKEIIKLMRHELGHALDNAFALRKNKERQKIFGSSATPYPKFYNPQKYSRRFVKYLCDGYAQSHPDEDFAETFAYWLDPEKKWQSKKLSPKVMAKLYFMDSLMKNLGVQKLKNSFCPDRIEINRTKLSTYYRDLKKEKNLSLYPSLENEIKSLRRIVPPKTRLRISIKKQKKKWIKQVSSELGVPQYQVNRSVELIIVQKKMDLSIFLKSKMDGFIKKSFLHLNKTNQLHLRL